jgi:MFS family permease
VSVPTRDLGSIGTIFDWICSCSAMFLDLANLSAITIALPTIEKEFNVGVGDLQWVISAYALTVR